MQGHTLMTHIEGLRWAQDYETHIYATDDRWRLPRRLPALYVIQTGRKSTQGEHYVAFIIETDRSVTYFDSYGVPPYQRVKTYLRGCELIRYNSRLLQSPFSSFCGLYVIAFAAFSFAGCPFKKFLSLFSEDPLLNDVVVQDFIKSLQD